jgi:uncharacterized membrane protein
MGESSSAFGAELYVILSFIYSIGIVQLYQKGYRELFLYALFMFVPVLFVLHAVPKEKVYSCKRDISGHVTRVASLSLLSILLLILLGVAICATAYIAAVPQPGEPFTELYLLGPSGKASGYPTNLSVGQNGTVVVGVVNHENADVSYRLVMQLNNTTLDTRSFTLANNEKWEQPLSFTAKQRGAAQKVTFDLFKGSDPNAYRSVYLFITVQ